MPRLGGTQDVEPRVVVVSHEDGSIRELARNFAEFIAAYEAGEISV